MKMWPPIELLNLASEKLGALCSEVVFLGGAVVGLLITEKGGPPPRATRDVDVAIEVGGSVLDVYEVDRRLLALGFVNDITGPICRYLHGPTVVDVVPVHPERPGEVNGWYPLAIRTPWLRRLDNGIEIRVIAPVCFLGTKLTAFRDPKRENRDDIMLSRDFGDVVRVLDGRPSIVEEVRTARPDLREFLALQFGRIVEERYLTEAISEKVDPGRVGTLLAKMRGIAERD